MGFPPTRSFRFYAKRWSDQAELSGPTATTLKLGTAYGGPGSFSRWFGPSKPANQPQCCSRDHCQPYAVPPNAGAGFTATSFTCEAPVGF
jgi:hypothetical protein